jgi:predicted GH43/DUF377 family glycosyl hydrolase
MKNNLAVRHPDNPIVRPGKLEWRRACVYNPGVWQEDDGAVYMLERAAKSLRPHITLFGLLKSTDGVSFTHVVDKPVFTAQEIGFPYGSVEDARLVKMDGLYYLNFAITPNSWVTFPNGWGIPTGFRADIPGVCYSGERQDNKTRSGIAVSRDLIHWEMLGETCEIGEDDRDQVLFPRKIDGYYHMLRRPAAWVGAKYGCTCPSMWITRSRDLKNWEPARLFMQPEYEWESHKIGASAPPVEIDQGWLALYHGVTCPEPDCPAYSVGAVLLDKSDPSRILGRTRRPILEPEHYYEKVGLIIPNTVFPCGNIVRDRKLWIYYGCCDTCISLATIDLDVLLSLLS